jgi:putative endopeptidase
MTRLFAFALASTALAACATQAPPPPPAAPATPVAAVAPPEASAPKPEYGTFGFDTAGMDKSVAPGDDFFSYANGTWVKNTPIPPDKARYGLFDVLQDLST